MQNSEKIKFIEETIVLMIKYIEFRGCDEDWFYHTYKELKNIDTGNFPKFVQIFTKEYNTSQGYFMFSEDKKYLYSGSLTFINEDTEIFNSDNLWLNGDKKGTLGHMYAKEVSEDEYIQHMYEIALSYRNKYNLTSLEEELIKYRMYHI